MHRAYRSDNLLQNYASFLKYHLDELKSAKCFLISIKLFHELINYIMSIIIKENNMLIYSWIL